MKKFLGGLLSGIILLVLTQHLLGVENNKILYRKLLEEIRINNKQGFTMELTGKFVPFEIECWDNFKGSNAFYKLPNDVKRTLDTYYVILKWYNRNLLEFKKLDDRKGEMTMEQLSRLVNPYLQYLLDEKIIKEIDANPQWISKELDNKR